MATIQLSKDLDQKLNQKKRKWLVTGVAGFIGSNLLEALLRGGQQVVGLDNFSTGSRANLESVRRVVSSEDWARFELIEGDIRNAADCKRASAGTELVLHQAALGSVPRSIQDPKSTHESNVNGFVNMLIASREAGAWRMIYASSSSVYGDSSELPKVESRIGKPLSPYAASKLANEIYAHSYARAYGMSLVGLRYFNVFGRRQNPNGEYAAVIPRWFKQLLKGEPVVIFGDGETSRDFSYVDNVVEANLLAALQDLGPGSLVCNIGCGCRTTLNDLFGLIRAEVARRSPSVLATVPKFTDFRAGDLRHSHADISYALEVLGYKPHLPVAQGIARTAEWYLETC